MNPTGLTLTCVGVGLSSAKQVLKYVCHLAGGFVFLQGMQSVWAGFKGFRGVGFVVVKFGRVKNNSSIE